METTEHASPFCHVVIPAPDLAKAKSFYERVFGWRVQQHVPGETYWFFHSGNVAGAFNGNAKPAPNSTVLVLRVPEMERCLALVEQNGGIVTRRREQIGEASPGHDAYFQDPNGNEMGVYSES